MKRVTAMQERQVSGRHAAFGLARTDRPSHHEFMQKPVIAAVSFMLGALPAQAEPSFLAGITATSDYVSNGVSQTDGKGALQAYLEYTGNGFYLGSWMSNVEIGDDRLEVDLYAGYRHRFANGLFLDLGYARYLYNASGDCCGELKLTAVYPLFDNTLGLEAYGAYDPESHGSNLRVTAAYEVTGQLGLSAAFGRTSLNDNAYWDAGGSFAFNDTVSADLRYYGAQSGDAGLVFALSFATEQGSFRRLLAAPFAR